MINLNGAAGFAVVHAVKLEKDYKGNGIHGHILAFTGTEFVTWAVSSYDEGKSYDAYSGHYLAPGDASVDAYILHLEDFRKR